MQPINSIETYAYGTIKDLASGKKEIKYNSIKNNTKNNHMAEWNLFEVANSVAL